jgi:hypothetical protein
VVVVVVMMVMVMMVMMMTRVRYAQGSGHRKRLRGLVVSGVRERTFAVVTHVPMFIWSTGGSKAKQMTMIK